MKENVESTLCRRHGSNQRSASGILDLGRGRSWSLVSFTALTSTSATDFSQDAYDAFADIDAAVQQADDPSELASLLSPTLDESEEMNELDAAGVQSVIAVAQSSSELWYDNGYAEIVALDAQMSADLDPCLQGQMENESYEIDDITYICLNSQWVQARFRMPPSGPRRLYLTATVASAAVTCPSFGFRWRAILGGDAAGALTGALMGIPEGPAGIAAGAFTLGAGASIVTGVGMAFANWWCNQT